MIPTQTNLQPVYWVTSAPVSPAMNPGGLAHEDELLDRTTAEREADSVVLLECAIMALALANSPWAWAYEQRLGVGAQQSDRRWVQVEVLTLNQRQAIQRAARAPPN